MIEQWERVPDSPAGASLTRSQVGLGVVDYADTLSLQAMALADLKVAEVSLVGSRRVFLSLTDEGKFLASSLSDEVSSAGVEVARNFESKDGHYGRLGLSYLRSFPGGGNWVHLSLSGGLHQSPALPWFLSLESHLFLSYPRSSNFISVRGTSGRTFGWGNGELSLGGFLWWTYRLRGLALPPNPNGIGYQVNDFTFEHMLFSLGPSASYRSPLGLFRADLLFRLWLDEELIYTGSETLIGYPSEFGPSVQLSYTYFF